MSTTAHVPVVTPGLDFIALDFETANPRRGSICQIGIARVVDGLVVSTRTWLVQPPKAEAAGSGRFDPRCIAVHGITADQVRDAPRFIDKYAALMRGLGDSLLVAHNAPFDRSALTQACEAEGLDAPKNQWLCTVEQARRLLMPPRFVMPDHKLPSVAAALGVEVRNHHDAGEDARVAAELHIAMTTLSAEPVSARRRRFK